MQVRLDGTGRLPGEEGVNVATQPPPSCAPRPRAQVLLQPLFGGQVRIGQLLRLPAAGAGRAGRERGHHHVRPGPLGSGLSRRGSQVKTRSTTCGLGGACRQLQPPPLPPISRGVTGARAALGPKAALAVIRGGAARASSVFCPWRFHLLRLLRPGCRARGPGASARSSA